MISSRLAHTLRRTAITAQTGFTAASIRNRQQATTRRSYAEAHYHERKKGHVPWYVDFHASFRSRRLSADHANRLFLSAALAVPAAYYLYNSGPQETAHGAGPKRPLVKGPEEGAKVSGEKQSERDPVSA